MKKRLQGLIIGILIGALSTSGMVFAKQISETAELFYNNIKIYIDGGEIIPKDANGNTVEPFTMNGTTYLPVRAISNALGKDVEWDGATQSVYIGKRNQTKPDNYLDKIQYNDYRTGDSKNGFAIINGTATDYNGNVYTNGLLFWLNSTTDIPADTDGSDSLVAYPLNSQYKTLMGKIVIPKSYDIVTDRTVECKTPYANDIFFYGDGKLLYKATAVNASMPFNFDIDITGVNQLTIKLKTAVQSNVVLTDLALYK